MTQSAMVRTARGVDVNVGRVEQRLQPGPVECVPFHGAVPVRFTSSSSVCTARGQRYHMPYAILAICWLLAAEINWPTSGQWPMRC
jgi:hypothetical protein